MTELERAIAEGADVQTLLSLAGVTEEEFFGEDEE